MKIAIVSEYAFFGGGISQSLNEIAPLLRQKGHKTTLITTKNEHLAHLDKKTKKYLYGCFDRIKFIQDLNSTKTFNEMYRILKDTDIIHIHETLTVRNLSVTSASIAKVMNKPYIVTIHTTYPTRPSRELRLSLILIRHLANSSKKIIAVSPSVRKVLVEKYKIPPAKIDVIDNGVDLEKFKYIPKITAREKLNLRNNQTMLLFVGRLVKNKNYILLKKLAKNVPCFLLIVAVGADKIFKGITNIKTYEYVSPKQLNLLYSSADAFLLPSTKGEGMPLVLLEALASGTPILVANALGNMDLLNKNVGESFKPNNINSLAEKLLVIKTKKSEDCRKHAENYPWEKAVNKLIRIYNENRI